MGDASAVFGGARPASLMLLLDAFSAFALAPERRGHDRPGFYHRVLAGRRVAGPIVVLRSDHDRAPRPRAGEDGGGGERACETPTFAGHGGDARTKFKLDGSNPADRVSCWVST